MLKTLELSRYRGFESYRLGDLTRVNLLVGMNNCGKTSILNGNAVGRLVEASRRDGNLYTAVTIHMMTTVHAAQQVEQFRSAEETVTQ